MSSAGTAGATAGAGAAGTTERTCASGAIRVSAQSRLMLVQTTINSPICWNSSTRQKSRGAAAATVVRAAP